MRGSRLLRALGWAASAPLLLAALLLTFGELDEGAALCRRIGWGLSRALAFAGGIGCFAALLALWKWCLGIRSWDDYGRTDGKGNN